MSLAKYCAVAAAALCAGLVLPVAAQTSQNVVATNTAWSTFVDGNPKRCWSVAAASQSENTRDGKSVSVSRGDVRLFVTYGAGAKGEVSFTGGYPFASGSTVKLDVGGKMFELYPDTSAKDWAWAGSADDDVKIITALKAGSDAVLTARSGRGTQTKDTFSLAGFSASNDEAVKRCGQ